jgi:methylated-DNA-[protein]-cysteine S-methyltransferase
MNNNENPGYYRFVIGNSPLGAMEIICSDLGLFMVNYFTTNNPHPEIRLVNNHPILKETEFQILEYLTGNLKRFTIPIDWSGMTPFSLAIRQACCGISFGETTTYSALASTAGHPGKARAAGNVNSLNPMPLVIPCQRVIGKDGKLHGYAGPEGVETKRWLLDMESKFNF